MACTPFAAVNGWRIGVPGVVSAFSSEYTTGAQGRRPARGIAPRPRSTGFAGRGRVAGDGKGCQWAGAGALLPIPLQLAFAGGTGCLQKQKSGTARTQSIGRVHRRCGS